jgi:DivIVA domain-containing protein
MIDLTPLEVRKKKGDFRRALRGYDPALVDDFLDLVADRLDELVREKLALSERVARQDQRVTEYSERERALTEALVTAQELREEVRRQTAQEAQLARRTAEQEAAALRSAAQQEAVHLRSAAQREAAALTARTQAEVAELRAALRQEREREEAALRILRARQEQFLTAYRAFLEEELNELGGLARALGLTAHPPATPESVESAGRSGGQAAAGVAAAGVAGALAGLAALELAAGAADVAAAAAPERVADAAVEPDSPVEEPGAGLEWEWRAPDALEAEPGTFELEPFEPEPVEPEDDRADLSGASFHADTSLEEDPSAPAEAYAAGDDTDLDALLRNAEAAGYSLEELDEREELLLLEEEETAGGEADRERPDGDGWLPGLLDDEK